MIRTRTWSHRAAANTVSARGLLEARASQVVRVLGYKIDIMPIYGAAFSDDADRFAMSALLQAAPMAPTVPPDPNVGEFDTLVRYPGNFGALLVGEEIFGPTNVSVLLGSANHSSGWIPCDFECPGVWVVMCNVSDGSAPVMIALFTLAYDWVARSSEQVAALYTTWGIDSVDATERHATLDINFNQSPGVLDLGAIVG